MLPASAPFLQVTYKQPGMASSVLTSCRRMVVSPVQSFDNMKPFLKDIDATERAAFEGITYSLVRAYSLRPAHAVNACVYTGATGAAGMSKMCASALQWHRSTAAAPLRG